MVEKLYKTKKAFVENTSRELTEEECAMYIEHYGKDTECRVINTWKYYMGRIGSCSRAFITKAGREKDFNDHPDWRPLAVCNYCFQTWKGDYESETIYAQSWEEIREKCSDTENMTWRLFKHPHQW